MTKPQFLCHTITLGRRGQDAVSEYSIQTRSCGRNTVFGQKMRCSGNWARKPPSSKPQFPYNVPRDSAGVSLRVSLPRGHFQLPLPQLRPKARVASSDRTAGAQPRRAGRSHSPPLAAIFTCPVSKGDTTRRRLSGPPERPSRVSSWQSLRFWLAPSSSFPAAASAGAAAAVSVCAFRALRRRHVRKPVVRHRVKWAEMGRDWGGGGGGGGGGVRKRPKPGLANHGPRPGAHAQGRRRGPGAGPKLQPASASSPLVWLCLSSRRVPRSKFSG